MNDNNTAIVIVAIMCLTLFAIVDRFCKYGEATTWEQVELVKAQENTKTSWQEYNENYERGVLDGRKQAEEK